MSTASASRTIKFIRKSGTYTAVIMSPSGDLLQEYKGTADAPGDIVPDYSAMAEGDRPVLYFVLTSSRVAEGVVTPDSVSFFFNNEPISFGSDNVSTGTCAGLFKKIFPSGDGTQPYYGLRIMDNLVVASLASSCVIGMKARITVGTQEDYIQANYTVKIQKYTGEGYRVTIAAGDTKNFVLREKGDSCVLKALTYQGGTEITGGLSYKWYKLNGTSWKLLSGETSQTLTMNEGDIDTYGEYRVEVFRGSSTPIGTDIQSVMDASDPWDIQPNPSPEDETITEGGNETVTYTPKVVKRGTNDVAIETTFDFVKMDAAGVILGSATGAASFTVDISDCQQSGGDVSVTITSREETGA